MKEQSGLAGSPRSEKQVSLGNETEVDLQGENGGGNESLEKRGTTRIGNRFVDKGR